MTGTREPTTPLSRRGRHSRTAAPTSHSSTSTGSRCHPVVVAREAVRLVPVEIYPRDAVGVVATCPPPRTPSPSRLPCPLAGGLGSPTTRGTQLNRHPETQEPTSPSTV